jgi:hypothetical protein
MVVVDAVRDVEIGGVTCGPPLSAALPCKRACIPCEYYWSNKALQTPIDDVALWLVGYPHSHFSRKGFGGNLIDTHERGVDFAAWCRPMVSHPVRLRHDCCDSRSDA